MNYAKYILDDTGDVDDGDSSDGDSTNASLMIEEELPDENATPARSLSPPVSVEPEFINQLCLKSEVGLAEDELCTDSNMSWYDIVIRDERKASYPLLFLILVFLFFVFFE